MNKLAWLIDYLKSEYKELPFRSNNLSDFEIYRSFANIRRPNPISAKYIKIQDEFLTELRNQKHITDLNDLKEMRKNIYLWQGDITNLRVDAIVNAANSNMTGCYAPCHNCIDNVIHTYAGVQLRLDCFEIIKNQGHPEETGKAKITPAYNLPCKMVIHTVGPIVSVALSNSHCTLLESCYLSCLDIAIENNLKSIAFCCISTGEFSFPNQEAAKIAINTVTKYINEHNSDIKVVFNVFKDLDYQLYYE